VGLGDAGVDLAVRVFLIYFVQMFIFVHSTFKCSPSRVGLMLNVFYVFPSGNHFLLIIAFDRFLALAVN
jgi:hypothetical protein